MSGPIFGSSSALGGSSGGNRHLVEFRAGRMNLVNKMVHPDNRKGMVYVYQADDGLIHFCWKDRTTGNVEDDLIVFPDDCEFKKIENVKNGRVFLLKFKSSSRRLFFWMQEPKTDKDDEWCRRINEVINNPPSSNSLGGGSGRGGNGSDNGDLQYIMQNMSQQQLMQLFGGVGQMGGLSSLLGSMSSRTSTTTPSSRTTTLSSSNAGSGTAVTTPTATSNSPSTPRAPRKQASDSSKSSGTATATPVTAAAGAGDGANNGGSSTSTTSGSGNRVLLSDLQNYLAGMSPAAAGAGQRRNVDLSTAVNSESLSSVMTDQEKVDALVEHLPNIEGDENKKQQLKETLSSPQFQQALSMFSNALQSGQLGPVVSQFQLNAEAVAAANSGDLEQFVKALENAHKKSTESEKSKSSSSAASSESTETAPSSKEENGTPVAKTEKKDDDQMTG
ncbi:proteasomal ubiquitin receptor ADRM1 homolog isoform X1 [Aedes albopictus]|uniref:Adhesion regulating molecule 1 110 kDa cell membrane glycoprotein n=1 Tax=Aedes albopictus TaxID=7160 RepID=A0ABM1YER4_AEDAL|nr:proteasomal ubiquitin receptor ADRM1 homolog isoform X1 [Aedes albopictus]KXJ81714.1 hypothetical protein RP20_CCG018244 [Aedes albopictus]